MVAVLQVWTRNLPRAAVFNALKPSDYCMYQQLVNLEYDRQYKYKRNTKTRSRSHRCRGKVISITYSQCLSVALGMQHAKRMRRVILSPVACPALPYFFHIICKKGKTFENRSLNVMCVLIFSKNSVLHISHSKQNWERDCHELT